MENAPHDNSSSSLNEDSQRAALGSLHNAQHYDDRPRTISFQHPLTTATHNIPLRTTEENAELFYQRQDFAFFQAKEQQRYDRMMMKRIQEMVTEAMKDELEAAHARNATPEEIDAMMPRTTEEIFKLLGGIPTMDVMKPPSAPTMHKERMVNLDCISNDHLGDNQNDTSNDTSESERELSLSSGSQEDVKKERCNRPGLSVEATAEDLYDMMGLQGDGEVQEEERMRPQRPEKWAEAGTDEDMYDLFGLDCDDAADNTGECGEESDEVDPSDVMKQQKFHLGNDDPSETGMFDTIGKNDAMNDILGTSFSSEVHIEDLVPLSPKISPRHSPMRSAQPKPRMVQRMNLDDDSLHDPFCAM
jgi:hypothetical protein